MNSESLYRYSKTKQNKPGFLLLKGKTPEIIFEHINTYMPTDTFGLFGTVHFIGRYRCNSDTYLYRDPLGSFDLFYVYSGNPVIKYADSEKSHSLSPGMVFVGEGSKPYELRYNGKKSSDVLLLSHFGFVSEKYYGFICKNGSQSFGVRSKDVFNDLLQTLVFHMTYPFLANQILHLSVLTQILTEVYLSTFDPESYTVQGQPKWLINALTYMDKNYHRRLTIADIAGSCSLSVSHFHKMFKDHIGFSPYTYLIKLRIIRAKALLAYDDMSVKCVARTVGFSSVNHFITHFYKENGCTPAAYQKYHQSNL